MAWLDQDIALISKKKSMKNPLTLCMCVWERMKENKIISQI